ncbi:RDD family protein [Aureivirga sp. CE67]|uniref:RDD family protein n=1 Tax=Aureivirga sp. CE67 TaxID=1788983 RepID=UPI0018CA31BB|nr:cytochrome c oxidase assembly factor Coa1 family protein [Aureivirga sp. CE67]
MYTDKEIQEFEFKRKLSSRKRRIVAFTIDHFIIISILMTIIFSIIGFDNASQLDVFKKLGSLVFVFILAIVLYLIKDGYNGTSIGKWIMGIKIRRMDDLEKAPSFGQTVVRNLLIVIWPIEFIYFASNEKKQRIGDVLAKTVVIKSEKKSPVGLRIGTIISLGLTVCFFLFFFVISTLKQSDAYKASIMAIENNPEILEETGGIEGYGFFMSGQVNYTNDYGEAAFDISVNGKLKDVSVKAYLTKESDGDWVVQELQNYNE